MPILQDIHRILNFQITSIGGTPVTLTSILIFVMVLIVAAIVSRWIQRLIRVGMQRRGVTDEGTVGVAARLLHYAIMLLAMGVGLQTVGIHLSALFAAGAVFAVGIGFAMQDIAQNFVSGVILLLERTIRPGDILEIEGQHVRVTSMGIRATIVTSMFNEEFIVPNGKLVQSTIKNYTLGDRVVRLSAEVGVSYHSDLDAVRAALVRAGETIDDRDPAQPPLVLLTGFGASSVDFSLSVWVVDPWKFYRLRSELLLAIWRELRAVDVEIAFPQLDVHFDRPVVEALTKRAA